ncbi:hypothetical protein AMIS_35760 [Actinoplanes missouriensis 431]|uniref:Uncharacterized protein n=1 Tax=Actinoplanes missouriensis (strain ATCC 14538 / DSM 43046 / CBS 188.64 / JCM 3121 / NBRC 102363 / NCIMB 12654 / NRRL B-3342 / UNCC 431) TaxID=512565 RepID=I0H709_ACTM4|nr:hypothetical protein [Actinoplanes missouriensis]BAL88796.1 hypothetical protein AMIS_35760 [Actinoplanes missouriensis 431]
MEEWYRPDALRVRAEYGDDDPVWASDGDLMDPVELAELGVSEPLIAALRAWNAEFNGIALTGFEFRSAEVEEAWGQEGLRLAHLLQNELPDIEISYGHDDDPRPLRARRGPAPVPRPERRQRRKRRR